MKFVANASQVTPEIKKVTTAVKGMEDEFKKTGVTGLDPLGLKTKKVTDEVTKLKQQVKSLGSGPSGGFKWVDSLNKGLKTASTNLGDMKKKMDDLKASGFGNILTGGAAVAPIIHSLDSAGKFQQGMVTISGATGATPQDIASLKQTIRDASNVTKFSTAEVQEMAIKAATSGMSVAQVQQLTPIMAKFAEVQQFGKGTSSDEAVTDAISSAHMLGIYDPKQLDAYLNNFNKATFMTPGSTSEFFDTFKYAAPTAKALGMSNDDILYTSALANRVGMLGSMGGTESADMILRSIPGIFGGQGHVDKDGKFKPSQQLKAMMDLGLAKADGSSVFYNNKGQFLGIENFINNLSEAAKTVNPEQLTKDFKNMFGLQGMKLADILSERGGEQLQVIKQQMDSMKSITQLQDDYNKSYDGQLAQFKTNLENLNQDVGTILLPTATNLIKTMQPMVTDGAKWIATHEDEVKKIAEVAGGFGALMIALGTAKIVFGTIGSVVLDPLKKGIDGVLLSMNAFKTKSAVSKSLPEQAIRANIVNVYGAEINGGGGGIDVAGGSSGKGKVKKIPGKIARTPSSVGGAAVVAAEDVAEVEAKSGWLKSGASAAGGLIKGAAKRSGALLPISLAFSAYDVMSAPEGHKVETAAKASGGIIGGWAGAEAGAAMGAAIGSVVPGLGTAIGAVLGGAIGGIAGSMAGDKIASSAYDAIQRAMQSWGDYKKQIGINATAPFSGDFNMQQTLDLSKKYGSSYGVLDKSKYSVMQRSGPLQKTYNDHSTYNINVQTNDPDTVAKQAPVSMNILKRDWAMANTQ
jgi:TP901 family phage tail tape measure protein